MSLTLTWYGRSDQIDVDVWQRCFAPGRQGLFWFRSLEQGELDDQFTFFYGLVRRDGEVIALVPAFVFDVPLDLVAPPWAARCLGWFARGPLRAWGCQRTFFIGNVAGEEGSIGLAPGVDLAPLAMLIHDAARAKADEVGAPLLTWKDVEHDQRRALDSLLTARGAFRLVSYPGTSVPLRAGGFEAFLAGQKSSRRHQLRKKLKRGEAAGSTRVERVHRPGDAELQELFALFEQTYRKASTRFERLGLPYFRALAACDETHFIVLRGVADGRAQAFMLVLDLGTRAINQFIGIDYTLGEDRYLYFRLFAAAYDWASETGATRFHSGQTGYRAKLDLGHRLVPLWNYARHRNPLLNRLFAWIGGDVSWRTLDADLAHYLHAHPEAEQGLQEAAA